MRDFTVLILAVCLAALSCAGPGDPQPLSRGDVHGHTCNPDTGLFVADADVRIDAFKSPGLVAGSFRTTADDTGAFALAAVPAGTQTLQFDKAIIGFHLDRVITVIRDVDTEIEMPECVVPTGSITGRICDQRIGEWLPDAYVYLDGNSDMLEARTADDGSFTLGVVPAGHHVVVVRKNDLTKQYDTDVVANQTVAVGDTICDSVARGTVSGRICATQQGDGYWVSNARVSVHIGDLVVETRTGINGFFTLAGIPAGEQTINVERGSFATSFVVTVLANQTMTLPTAQCLQQASVHVAVVTGMFDSIETILGDLGFSVRTTYDVTYPAGQEANTDGSVDLIDGKVGDYYVSAFLSDAQWMGRYDIIFFNCGLQDAYFLSAPQAAIDNLRAFVDAGGSIYVSDYASEILRITFPGHIDWLGSEDAAYSARVGDLAPIHSAHVLDENLATQLGSSTPYGGIDVIVNFNDSSWVVMENVTTQEALGTKVWVKGTAAVKDYGMYSDTVTDAALMVSYPYGANGGHVVFTSFHNQRLPSDDTRAILEYIVFEL
jgi:hypothetical protein